MKPECRRIRPLLGPLADGELGPEQAAQVQAHLAGCSACSDELATLNQLHALVRKVEPPSQPEDFWDWQRTRIWRRIRQQRPARQQVWRPAFSFPRLATLAGGLVVVLVVVVVGWLAIRSSLNTSRRVAQVEAVLEKMKERVEPPAQPEVRAMPAPAPGPAVARVPQPTPGTSGQQTPLSARAVIAEQEQPHEPVEQAQIDGRERASATRPRRPHEPASGGTVVGAAAQPEPERREIPDEELYGQTKQRGGTAPVPARPEGEDWPAEEATTGRPVRVGSTAPRVIAMPKLPDVEEEDTGTVLLTLVTDTLGRVRSVKLARSSGKPLLDSIAIRTALEAIFAPATRDGKPVTGIVQQKFKFNPAKKLQPEQQK